MIEWSSLLSIYDRVDFMQLERFLTSRGAGENDYWLAPVARKAPAATDAMPVVVSFDGSSYADGGAAAKMSLRLQGRSVEVLCGLPTATRLLTYVFDEAENQRMLTHLDPDASAGAAAAFLNIDAGFERPVVGAYRSGDWIAPVESGWQLFMVEDYGAIARIANSSIVAPLVYLLAMRAAANAGELAERVAAFIPSNSAAIIQAG